MKRRNFIRTTALGSIALGFTSYDQQPKTHILTLSFDDGFKNSFYKIAEIHEKFGLKACLNIIASAHITKNEKLNEYHKIPVGNFEDWNKLKSRGHEIMPHSWDHSNLKEMPLEQAKEDIERCNTYFEKNLDGYKSSLAVYNFAYNASTPELVDFLLTRVRAIRTGGWDILGEKTTINPFPKNGKPVRLGCWSFGPENADKWVEQEVSKFLTGPKGWLILNLHGLDEEGWGPVSSLYLEKLLERLVKIDYLDVLPAGMVLEKY
jgi:peptidoglycan/xylan/chitin deacetylase (PgdA/CDA1 family)